jgi:hypothetical protein
MNYLLGEFAGLKYTTKSNRSLLKGVLKPKLKDPFKPRGSLKYGLKIQTIKRRPFAGKRGAVGSSIYKKYTWGNQRKSF